MRSCTVVLVAHRLSTVIGADLIAVINDGVIVEKGLFERQKRKNRCLPRGPPSCYHMSFLNFLCDLNPFTPWNLLVPPQSEHSTRLSLCAVAYSL